MTAFAGHAKPSTAFSKLAASRSVFLVHGAQDQGFRTQFLNSSPLLGECRDDYRRVGLCRSDLLHEFARAQPDGRNLEDFDVLTEDAP